MSLVQNADKSANDLGDDTVVLLKWLSLQVLPVIIPKEIEIPLQMRRITNTTTDTRIFLPVFQRLLYSHGNDFQKYYSENIVSFFVWIDKVTSHMNLLYLVFQLGPKEIILLKRSEFSIYQGFIDNITADMKEFLAKSEGYGELYQIAKTLVKVNLIDTLDELIYHISKSKINNQIEQMYADTPIFADLEKWIVFDLYESLKDLVSQRNFTNFKDTLLHIGKTTLISRRIEHIFNLVNEYPNSVETLKEFHVCLSKNDEKNILVKGFIEDLNSKLLLPSINTTQIILYYIKTIHSFLIIDHRGVLLDKVARSIRRYLCSRKDTVEKIVDGLLNTVVSENKLIELNTELHKDHLNSTDPNSMLNLQKRTLNWVPDPVDALPDFQIGKIDDIIESVTSIFEDNTLFIDQFAKIFCVNLLNIKDYEISGIVQNLTLLKSKFTDNDFNKIDVMINDIVQSKQLDDRIMPSGYQRYHVHGVFLSRLFWPNLFLDSLTFNFCSEIQEELVAYESAYNNIQKGRALKLHPQHTSLEVDINLNGVSKTYDITLDKYSVLSIISELNIPVVKIGVIMMKLKMPLQLIRASLDFWVKEDVLIEINGGWRINE